VALFNTFPSVLLMDSTYKTNHYGSPLFEMMSATSTGMTFNVAFSLCHTTIMSEPFEE
jgi:hypothetical protein